jgi:hypothetical protein
MDQAIFPRDLYKPREMQWVFIGLLSLASFALRRRSAYAPPLAGEGLKITATLTVIAMLFNQPDRSIALSSDSLSPVAI